MVKNTQMDTKENNRKQVGDSKVFDVVIYAISILASLICLIPIMRIVSMAVSSKSAVMTGSVLILPKEFTLEAIKFIVGQNSFQNSFFLTIFVVLITVGSSLFFTIFMAYPLSRDYFKGKKIIMVYVVFTMLFVSGMIPVYSLFKKINLLNHIGVLILPRIIIPFNLIILINYFKGIPNEVEESAMIDGASNLRILWQIFVPLSKASIATLTLFIAVNRWNMWYDALVFYGNKQANMLQIFLRDIIMLSNPDVQQELTDTGMTGNVTMAQVQSAALLVSTLPIVLVYPFLQKYFVKGVVLGSVKG